MFNGIVECTCRVVAAEEGAEARRLVLDLSPLRRAGGGQVQPKEPLVALGDSVAVNGCCLTVAALQGDRAAFDVVTETLRCTNLGALATGDSVNVERSLRFGDRVDGHLVAGHVEGTGRVEAVERRPGEVWLTVACGAAFTERMLHKGSIAVDGVSLTVADLGPERFSVALVPHTLDRTNLGHRQPGDAVNLEPDMIGQWVVATVRRLQG